MFQQVKWLLVVALLLPVQSWAWTFTTVDAPFPGASATACYGRDAAGGLICSYADGEARDHGMREVPGDEAQTLLNVTPHAVCAEGVVGSWRAPTEVAGGTTQGFLFANGTFRTLIGPRAPRPCPGCALGPQPLRTEALGCGHGKVVGTYQAAEDNQEYGFVYDIATRQMTKFSLPATQRASLVGTDTLGRLIGYALGNDNVRRLFRYEPATDTLTILTIPGHADSDVRLVGLRSDGRIAANVETQGLLYDGTAVELLAVPGAMVTQIHGLGEDGVVYGRYIDAMGLRHGFIATPDAAPLDERHKHRRRGHGLGR